MNLVAFRQQDFGCALGIQHLGVKITNHDGHQFPGRVKRYLVHDRSSPRREIESRFHRSNYERSFRRIADNLPYLIAVRIRHDFGTVAPCSDLKREV